MTPLCAKDRAGPSGRPGVGYSFLKSMKGRRASLFCPGTCWETAAWGKMICLLTHQWAVERERNGQEYTTSSKGCLGKWRRWVSSWWQGGAEVGYSGTHRLRHQRFFCVCLLTSLAFTGKGSCPLWHWGMEGKERRWINANKFPSVPMRRKRSMKQHKWDLGKSDPYWADKFLG